MLKKILIFVTIALLIALSFAVYLFNKKVPTLDHTKTDFVISANDLFNEFETNEELANMKYVDRILEVSGEIIGLHKDISDSLWSVYLKAENAMMYGINCSFTINPQQLEIGDEVTVKGQCVGKLEDVLLKNCLILK
jgi:hypothetical protein